LVALVERERLRGVCHQRVATYRAPWCKAAWHCAGIVIGEIIAVSGMIGRAFNHAQQEGS